MNVDSTKNSVSVTLPVLYLLSRVYAYYPREWTQADGERVRGVPVHAERGGNGWTWGERESRGEGQGDRKRRTGREIEKGGQAERQGGRTGRESGI